MKNHFTVTLFSGHVRFSIFIILSLALAAALNACATDKPYEINLMPAPKIYEEGDIDPFTGSNPIENIPYGGILYASDRLPAGGDNKHYMDERGGELRLGSAQIELGAGRITGKKRDVSPC
jgi:hypothetical protein